MKYTAEDLRITRDTRGDEFVVRTTSAVDGVERDEIAFDIDEALAISADRLQRATTYCVEIFRIGPQGYLTRTIGPSFSDSRLPAMTRETD